MKQLPNIAQLSLDQPTSLMVEQSHQHPQYNYLPNTSKNVNLHHRASLSNIAANQQLYSQHRNIGVTPNTTLTPLLKYHPPRHFIHLSIYSFLPAWIHEYINIILESTASVNQWQRKGGKLHPTKTSFQHQHTHHPNTCQDSQCCLQNQHQLPKHTISCTVK